VSTQLAELRAAADQAEDNLRVIGGTPAVLRQPGAEEEAHARWEAAHKELTAARHEMEAGQ